MIINGTCNGVTLLYANAKQGVTDPTKTYYSLGLFFPQYNQTGELNCKEDIYKAVVDVANSPDLVKKMSTVFDFETAYNTEAKYFYITRVVNSHTLASKSAK